jgi:hypothetical protein
VAANNQLLAAKEKWPLIVLLLANCFPEFSTAPAKLLAATNNNQLLAATYVAANSFIIS